MVTVSYTSVVGQVSHLFLLRRTTLQSFSQPPFSFSIPVWTICPTGTSRSLAQRCCSSSRAWSPVDQQSRTNHRVQFQALTSLNICAQIKISLDMYNHLTKNESITYQLGPYYTTSIAYLKPFLISEASLTLHFVDQDIFCACNLAVLSGHSVCSDTPGI